LRRWARDNGCPEKDPWDHDSDDSDEDEDEEEEDEDEDILSSDKGDDGDKSDDYDIVWLS
jgi:hypothetical protein